MSQFRLTSLLLAVLSNPTHHGGPITLRVRSTEAIQLELSTWPQLTWPWSPVGPAATALILRTLRRHQTWMILLGSSCFIVALHRCLLPQTVWHHPPHLPPRADFRSVSPARDAVVF